MAKQTVWKWRKRDRVEDRSHRPHPLQTTLTLAQEAVAVALRETPLVWFNEQRADRHACLFTICILKEPHILGLPEDPRFYGLTRLSVPIEING